MSSFTWWFINLGITFIWLAVGIKSGSWFLALGSLFYLAIALLVELPETSSDPEDWHENDDEEGLLS
ncbi:MAG: hypothetical protein WD904_07310 [Dehalococcoidia bacterium]